MMNVIYDGSNCTQDFKSAYSQLLIELAEQDENVVLMDADLLMASGGNVFRGRFPERTFDCGVQEANMIGVAAGMSERGLIPFTHSFSSFASRKCVDQIFMAGCYNDLNVKMFGTDPGAAAALNGGTHMGIEDMGVLFSFPNITLLEMTDIAMFRSLLLKIKDTYGMFYIRLYRKAPVKIYEEGSDFTIGKGVVVRQGTDVTIIASGIEVAEALKAAEILAAEGIQAKVIDMFTWKPIDEALITSSAEETGAIVVAENHSVNCGLGKEVARVVVQTCPVPMRFVGYQNCFGEVGPTPYLMERFHLTADDIVSAAKESMKQKNKGERNT